MPQARDQSTSDGACGGTRGQGDRRAGDAPGATNGCDENRGAVTFGDICSGRAAGGTYGVPLRLRGAAAEVLPSWSLYVGRQSQYREPPRRLDILSENGAGSPFCSELQLRCRIYALPRFRQVYADSYGMPRAGILQLLSVLVGAGSVCNRMCFAPRCGFRAWCVRTRRTAGPPDHRRQSAPAFHQRFPRPRDNRAASSRLPRLLRPVAA